MISKFFSCFLTSVTFFFKSICDYIRVWWRWWWWWWLWVPIWMWLCLPVDDELSNESQSAVGRTWACTPAWRHSCARGMHGWRAGRRRRKWGAPRKRGERDDGVFGARTFYTRAARAHFHIAAASAHKHLYYINARLSANSANNQRTRAKTYVGTFLIDCGLFMVMVKCEVNLVQRRQLLMRFWNLNGVFC